MTDVVFAVRGIPKPQGSGRSFVQGGRAVHVTTTAPLLAWRGAIAREARDALAAIPAATGPVAVVLEFRPKPRPASHYLPANRTRRIRVLRLDAPVHHTSTPDADKLARAALDALTGIAFEDDSQVASLAVSKRWPAVDEDLGVTIRISRLEETS